MKKLNTVIYNKLLAQAEEAKVQGKTSLASCILHTIGSYPEDEIEEYSHINLQEDIRKDTWKMATNLINYHGLESVDAEKLDAAIIACAEIVLSELEQALGVEQGAIGPLEPKVPGEIK